MLLPQTQYYTVLTLEGRILKSLPCLAEFALFPFCSEKTVKGKVYNCDQCFLDSLLFPRLPCLAFYRLLNIIEEGNFGH